MPLRPSSSTRVCRRRALPLLPKRQAQAGGEGRIRTSEGARPTDLQSVAFDRSATSPNILVRSHLHYRHPPRRAHRQGAASSAVGCGPVRPVPTLLAHLVLGTLPSGTGWRTREHQHTGPACPEKRRLGLPRTTALGHSSVTPRCFTWSWRRDLNPRPADYKSAALPD
jgi:hypothetical protein